MSWLDRPDVDWEPPDQAQRLLGVLSRAYKHQDDAHYMAMTIGLDVARLQERASLFQTWRSIIELAAAMGRLAKLVRYASNDPMIFGFRNELLSMVMEAERDATASPKRHFLDPAAPFEWARPEMQTLYRALLYVMRDSARAEMMVQVMNLPSAYVYWGQAMAYVMKDILELAHRGGNLANLIEHVLVEEGLYGALTPLCALMVGSPEGREILIKLLEKREDGVETVARALAVDPLARPALYGLLTHYRWKMRAGAIKCLGADPAERPRIRALLSDPVAAVRVAAAEALAKDVELLPALRALLADSDATVRLVTARLLVNDQEAHTSLRALLRDADASVRRAAIEMAGGNQDMEDVRISLLDDTDSTVREAAARSLAGCQRAAARLREMLHKDLKPVQIAASYALATMPEEHPALIDFLLTAPDLLDNATAALFMEDERALPLFRQRVKDCETARRALAAAGDASLLMELHQTLQSKNNWEAARGLTLLACAKDSRDLVRSYLGHHDLQLRMAAHESLLSEEKDPAELLRAASLDASFVIRRWAVQRLARDPATLPMARKFLNDGAPEVREAAVGCLVGDADSRVLIRHLLADTDSSVRGAAIVALADDSDSITAIEELLDDADPELRVVAAYELLQKGHLSYAELKTGGTP